MKNALRFSVVFLLALVWLAPRDASAVGEQYGRIRGTVTEAATSAPVPGADVMINGPNLIGGPRTVHTGDDGSYEIGELPAGRYDVEVSYSGVKPVQRRVIVRVGETVPLDIAWSPELVQQEVTVIVEERHLTRPDSTRTGTVLTADTESKLATTRSYQGIVQQVAGTKDDGRGIPTIHAANRMSNRYLVDGMDITDSVTNNFSTQVNFDSLASVEVITGGMEAQYSSLGGIINMITATGSDELHIDTSIYVNNVKFSTFNQTGSSLYEQDSPFATGSTPPTAAYNANLNISGPLVRNKLWASISLEYDYTEFSTVKGPPLNIQHPSRVQHNFFPRLKLTWAPNQKNRITIAANGDPALVYNRSQGNNLLGEAEYGQSQGGAFAVMQWDYFHSDNVGFNLQTGYNFNHVHQAPMGYWGNIDYGPRDPRFSDKNYNYDPNQPRHQNNFDGTAWYNGIPNQLDKRHTIEFDPSLILRGKAWGHHDAKIGIQSRLVYHTFKQTVPGGESFSENKGGPLESGLCDPTTGMGCNSSTTETVTPPFQNHELGYGMGFYAQDTWQPFRRLTILPGIRVDLGHTENSLGETVSNLIGVGPRLGFTLDLTGDRRTILSAYYGRATETMFLLPAIYGDVESVATTYRWDPTQNGGAGGFVYQAQSGGTQGYRLDPNVKPPTSDQVEVSLVREFFHNSLAGVSWTYQHIDNQWEAREINQIWDASGYRVIGYVNGIPERIFKYSTPDGNDRNYHGIDFYVEARPTPHWDLYASYTLSWLWGRAADEIFTLDSNSDRTATAYYNPRQYKFYEGYLPEDQRHMFKLRASYEWHGLSIGGTANYMTGFPLTKQYFDAANQDLPSAQSAFSNKRTPQGTEPGQTPNNPQSITQMRTPDELVVNLRAAFDFHELIHAHVILIADLFNVFNLESTTRLENRDLPTFGLATFGRQAPFRFQLGLRYLY